jgi:hypothetical protein
MDNKVGIVELSKVLYVLLKLVVLKKLPRVVFKFGISEPLTLFEVNILLYVKLGIASVTFKVNSTLQLKQDKLL